MKKSSLPKVKQPKSALPTHTLCAAGGIKDESFKAHERFIYHRAEQKAHLCDSPVENLKAPPLFVTFAYIVISPFKPSRCALYT